MRTTGRKEKIYVGYCKGLSDQEREKMVRLSRTMIMEKSLLEKTVPLPVSIKSG